MDSVSTAASPPGDAPPVMPEDAPPSPPAEGRPAGVVVSDPAAAAAVAAAAPAPTPMPVLDATTIAVPETCQLTDNMGMKYTAYRVEVRPRPLAQQNGEGDASAQPPPPHATTAVLRRYRDFAWLHAALSKERPGCVVPPVPEKNAVARFDSDFVEDRRSHLEQFARRASVHPELRDARCLDAFLRADDATFAVAKNAKPGAVPAATNNDVVCRVMADDGMTNGNGHGPAPPASGLANGAVVVGSVPPQPSASPNSPIHMPPGAIAPTASVGSGAVRGIKNKFKKLFSETKTQLAGKELVHSPDDHLFDEIQAYADALEKQMKAASARATSLVKKNKDSGADYAELGTVLATLGQAEGEGSSCGAVLKTVGETVSASLAPVASLWAQAELVKLDEPLHDHVKYVAALKYALDQRSNRRLTYTTALNKLGEKRGALAKYNGHFGADMKRYDAELSLQRAEAAAEVARVDFEGCSQRLLRETDRFRVQRANEMRATIVEYVRIQAEYTAKMSQVWSGLVPQVEAIPPADPGALAAPVYATNQNAGSVPPIPAVPVAPVLHPQYSMAPPPPIVNGGPAPAVPGQAPAPVVAGAVGQNGVAGENVGGMMYRSTADVAM